LLIYISDRYVKIRIIQTNKIRRRKMLKRFILSAILLISLCFSSYAQPPLINDSDVYTPQAVRLDQVRYKSTTYPDVLIQHSDVDVVNVNTNPQAEIKFVNVNEDTTDTYWYAARFTDFFDEVAVVNSMGLRISMKGQDLLYPVFTASLIEGYQRGAYTEPRIFLQGEVYNDVNRIDIFGEDAQTTILDNITSFTDYVVDLAVKLDNGVFYFKYRVYDVTKDTIPNNVTEASGNWNTIHQYTIKPTDGDTSGPGLKMDLLISIMVDPLSYKATLNHSTVNDDKGIIVDNRDRDAKTQTEIGEYNLGDWTVTSAANEVVIQCDPNELVEFRYAIWGTGTTPADAGLRKLTDAKTVITFKRYIDPDVDVPQSGDWYIADLNGKTVGSADTMDTGTFYHVYYYIRDNDSEFDLDSTLGQIRDPNVSGKSTNDGNDGGDGGFCFISTIQMW
jgi:hypothetical protein